MSPRSGQAPVWAFDVDGTLIGSVRSDRLRPGAPELLETLVARGVRPLLWSAGGASYARQAAESHGIAHYFVAFYAKQRRDALGRYTTDHFEAHHAPDVFVDDVPLDMPHGATVVGVAQFLGGNDADGALSALTARLDEWLER